jgi:hypothetical protein
MLKSAWVLQDGKIVPFRFYEPALTPKENVARNEALFPGFHKAVLDLYAPGRESGESA